MREATGSTLADVRRGVPADRRALVGPTRVFGYGELGEAAARLAREIAARKRDPAAPVAHAFASGAAGLLALHAVAEAGFAAAPAHPGWRPAERARFFATVAPDLVLCEPGSSWAEATEPWTARIGAFPPIVLGEAGRRAPPGGAPPPAGTEVLLWTSGSEGRPRVVCHAWSTLLAGAEAINERLDFGEEDAWLAVLAWAHVGGLQIALRAAAAGGAVLVGPARFAPGPVREALARGATHVSLVPAMLEALLEEDTAPPPPALRVVLVGGAATPPALVRRARAAGWPVALTYGLTEAGSAVATAPPDAVAEHPDRVGRPLASVELRLAPDGGIELRGPGLFLGYLGEPARDPRAWFPTGDLGDLDPEGGLRVTGRRAARIVTGGANVDPAEVEAALSAHPEVAEACVLGLPDERWGEIVTAVVTPRAAGDPAGLETRLEAWVRERLSGPRIPRRFRFVEALPRTATGKVDRRRLAERLGPAGEPGEPREPGEDPGERPRAARAVGAPAPEGGPEGGEEDRR